MREDREALESLMAHPGWRAFCGQVDQEWGLNGLRFQAELDKALNLTDNNAAASQARQIRSGQKVILALLRWPAEEATRLKRQEDEKLEADVVSITRGGYR